MKMRKVLVAFLAVICIIASVSTFGAYAEGASRVYAETDASVAQGSYGWAYIYLDDLVDLATLNIAVHYDSTKISVLDHYNSVGCTLYDASNKDGCLQYSYIFDGTGNSEKTNLFYFWYQINEDAEIGNTYFDIVITDAYNTSRQPVDIGGSRCNLTITERPITKECYVYGTYDVSTSVKEEFELDYHFSTWEIASGSAEISYDPELFEVVEITNGEFLSGKLVDVNSSLKGSVYLSFLTTEYNYYSDFLRIRFRTLKNVEDTSQITLTFSQLCDLELNTLVCSGFTTNMYVNFDDTYTEDAPSMSVSASYNAQSDKVTATIKLESDSKLGAGDFVLKFDTDSLTYNSAQKGFAPNFFNINDKDVADGILKFSILSLTDITDEQTVLTVVFDVRHSCEDKTSAFELGGSGLTDSLVNPILLNFVDANVTVPLNHTQADAVVENRVEPTCTANGSYDNVVYCSVCNAELGRDTIVVPATGHTDGQWVTDSNPTCTTAGSKHQVCATCGATINTGSIPATGHAEGAVVVENNVAPNCTEKGSYDNVVYCTVCNAELSKDTVVVDALGHTASAPVEENRVEADCVNNGSYDTVVYCAVCNKELERVTTTIPAIGHTESSVVLENNVAPNCTEKGSYDNVVYCTVCNAELSRNTVVVDALGHTTSAPVEENRLEADCVNTGSYDTAVYCSVCKEELERVATTIPALGHKPGSVVVENNVAPTCTADGSYDNVTYCEVCNAELSREKVTVPAAGHTQSPFVVENDITATCTEDGSYDNVTRCGNCEIELDRTTIVVPATGHSFGEWTVSTAPTCTEAGEERRDCNNCDHYETKELAALGHDYSNGGSCALCGKLSDGAVTGIVAGSAVAVGGGGFSLFWFVIRKKRFNIKK